MPVKLRHTNNIMIALFMSLFALFLFGFIHESNISYNEALFSEFGIFENLTIIFTFLGIIVSRTKIQGIEKFCVTALGIFFILEELSFGWHWLNRPNWLQNLIPIYNLQHEPNFHNTPLIRQVPIGFFLEIIFFATLVTSSFYKTNFLRKRFALILVSILLLDFAYSQFFSNSYFIFHDEYNEYSECLISFFFFYNSLIINKINS